MRINFLIVAAILFNAQTVIANNTTTTDTSGNNMLTSQEKQQGWKLLFDGKTLNGWRSFKNQPGSWKVNDGTLCSERSEENTHADLITDDQFENFELSIDWKVSPKGNSGIMYMVTEDYDAAFESGPEYQLIDDDGFPEHIEDWQKTGANYGMQPPGIKAANAPGQWNHTTIIVNKGHVEHWLNGKKTVEYDLGSEAWKKQKTTGKWKDDAGYAASKTGHIALQSAHSNVDDTYICFRNIKIKLL